MSEITLKKVYDELKYIEKNMVTKDQIEGLLETVEILSDKELVNSILKAEKEYKSGNTKEFVCFE